MTKTIRRKGWFIDGDGIPAIYKDRDAKLIYDITYTIQGTSFTANPTWTSDGATIETESFTLTGSSLNMLVKVADTGEAKVNFTDNLGNEEELTFRWLGSDKNRKKDYRSNW